MNQTTTWSHHQHPTPTLTGVSQGVILLDQLWFVGLRPLVQSYICRRVSSAWHVLHHLGSCLVYPFAVQHAHHHVGNVGLVAIAWLRPVTGVDGDFLEFADALLPAIPSLSGQHTIFSWPG